MDTFRNLALLDFWNFDFHKNYWKTINMETSWERIFKTWSFRQLWFLNNKTNKTFSNETFHKRTLLLKRVHLELSIKCIIYTTVLYKKSLRPSYAATCIISSHTVLEKSHSSPKSDLFCVISGICNFIFYFVYKVLPKPMVQTYLAKKFPVSILNERISLSCTTKERYFFDRWHRKYLSTLTIP